MFDDPTNVEATLEYARLAANAGLGRLIFNSGFEATVERDGGEKETITEPGFMIEFNVDPEGEISKLEATQEVIAGAMSTLYPARGEKGAAIPKEAFLALRERIQAGEEITLDELEQALGFDVDDTLDIIAVQTQMQEMEMEDMGMSGGMR